MSGVDVLYQGDLVASGGTLSRDDGRIGEEVFPNLSELDSYTRSSNEGRTNPEPSISVLCLDLLAVRNPITIPSP